MHGTGNSWVRLLACAMLAASASAQAEDFRIQAQAFYDQIDPDASDDDVDVLALKGTFYFKPVPTDGVPVGEAAYIDRSSYFDATASRLDDGNDNIDVFSANVGYHFTNSIFFARAGVVNTDFPDFPGSPGSDTTWNGTLGIVPIPRLFFGTDFVEGGYDPNITARYVGKLANDHWYGASVNVVDEDEGDTEAGFEFDYYFPAFKLGGGYHTSGDLVNFRAEVGLPHGFALLGRYYTADDSDGFGLTLTWRDL